MADAAPAQTPTKNPDVQRMAALTKLIATKKAQIAANEKVVTPEMLARFKTHLTQAQAELDATTARVKAAQ